MIEIIAIVIIILIIGYFAMGSSTALTTKPVAIVPIKHAITAVIAPAEPTYTVTLKSGLPGNDIKMMSGTLEQCKAECNKLAECSGYGNFNNVPATSVQNCWLKNQDAKAAKLISITDMDYYFKN